MQPRCRTLEILNKLRGLVEVWVPRLALQEQVWASAKKGLSLTMSYVPDIFFLLAEEKDSWKRKLVLSSYWKKIPCWALDGSHSFQWKHWLAAPRSIVKSAETWVKILHLVWDLSLLPGQPVCIFHSGWLVIQGWELPQRIKKNYREKYQEWIFFCYHSVLLKKIFSEQAGRNEVNVSCSEDVQEAAFGDHIALAISRWKSWNRLWYSMHALNLGLLQDITL